MFDEPGAARLPLAHQFIEGVAAKQPDLPALVSTGEPQLSYGELNARANALAHVVVSVLDRDDNQQPLVGLFIRKSSILYVAMVAVLKTGAAYVPLDPTFPAERIRNIVADSRMRIVLSTSDLKFPDVPGVRVLNIDALAPEMARQPRHNLHSRCTASDLAYVYFTSGSTGRPKGVMIEHRNIVNYARWAQDCFGIAPGRRTLQFTTINFDLAVSDIFSTLMFGGTLVIPTDAERFSSDTLADLIERFGVHIWMLAPAYLENMPIRSFPSLEVLIVAGEVCSPKLVESWSRHRAFYNGYGPTECTVLSTLKQLTSGDQCRNIGQPIAGLSAYILNEKLEPVSPGEAGELYIAGPSVGRGYVNNEALTRERFLPDPFCAGRTMYKTGDIVRKSPEGDLSFIGRGDRQVKIHGHRIELGEIEAQLMRIGYAKALVFVKDFGSGKQLIAHVTNPQRLDALVAKQQLAACLPGYMCPAFTIEHASFPLNAVGKVDLAQLEAMNPQLAPGRQRVPPATQLERDLAQLWSDLLAVAIEDIGTNLSFHELGGTSLKAMRLLARIRQTYGVELSFGEFSGSPNIQAMARAIASRSAKHGRMDERDYAES
jgi:amino acid adenylation domain-containing protein